MIETHYANSNGHTNGHAGRLEYTRGTPPPPMPLGLAGARVYTGAYTRSVWVTPEMATTWLERNHNRNRRPKIVARYAAAILRGEWEYTHQGVAFDVDNYCTSDVRGRRSQSAKRRRGVDGVSTLRCRAFAPSHELSDTVG